jgi:hypothetical protein
MRKNRLLLFLITLSIILFCSCKEKRPIKTKLDKKHTLFYIAIDQADTAWLKIDTTDQHILGELVFNYHNKKHYVGLVKAVMKGDTLKGNYSFKLNNVDKWYKNPIALLKKDDTFTMGIGEIYTLWGSGFFLKSVPIDYEKGRFVFKKVEAEF